MSSPKDKPSSKSPTQRPEELSTKILAINDTLTNADSLSRLSLDNDASLLDDDPLLSKENPSSSDYIPHEPISPTYAASFAVSQSHTKLRSIFSQIFLVLFLVVCIALFIGYSIHCVRAINKIQELSAKLVNTHGHTRVVTVGEHVHKARPHIPVQVSTDLNIVATEPPIDASQYIATTLKHDSPVPAENFPAHVGEQNVAAVATENQHVVPEDEDMLRLWDEWDEWLKSNEQPSTWRIMLQSFVPWGIPIVPIDAAMMFALSACLTIMVMCREKREVIQLEDYDFSHI